MSIQTRTGSAIELGSCTHCNQGCRGEQDDQDRVHIRITEIEMEKFAFRLCDQCRSSLIKRLIED